MIGTQKQNKKLGMKGVFKTSRFANFWSKIKQISDFHPIEVVGRSSDTTSGG